jgi:hypothetical protein
MTTSQTVLELVPCGFDDSLFKPREIRNWIEDDMLSYTVHRRGKTALYVSRTFLRQTFARTMLRKISKTPRIRIRREFTITDPRIRIRKEYLWIRKTDCTMYNGISVIQRTVQYTCGQYIIGYERTFNRLLINIL